MAIGDINRLRQQNIFAAPAVTSGRIGQGIGMNPNFLIQGMTNQSYGPNDFLVQGMTPNSQVPRVEAPAPPSVMAQEDPNNPGNWMEFIRQQYSPETVAMERFNRLLDEAPRRENPGLARRIAASAAAFGGGGTDAAEKFMYAPYARDVADFKLRAEPFYQAANLERQGNISERQLVGQMVTAQQAQQRIDETNRRNLANEDIARDRAALGWWKAQNPDADFNFTGPTVTITRMVNGKPVVEDTKISTGRLTDADKAQLAHKYRIAEGAQRIEGAKEVQEIRNERPTAQSARQPLIDRNIVLQGLYDRQEFRKFIIPPTTTNGSFQLAEPPKKTIWNRRKDVDKD